MRQLTDYTLQEAVALPAAGATAHTSAIDLEQDLGGAIENIEFGLELPVTKNLVAGKKITVSVQQSADGATFADTDPAITSSVTGKTGNGSDEKEVRFRLPSTASRHIRVALAVEADAGDVTGETATLKLFA